MSVFLNAVLGENIVCENQKVGICGISFPVLLQLSANHRCLLLSQPQTWQFSTPEINNLSRMPSIFLSSSSKLGTFWLDLNNLGIFYPEATDTLHSKTFSFYDWTQFRWPKQIWFNRKFPPGKTENRKSSQIQKQA